MSTSAAPEQRACDVLPAAEGVSPSHSATSSANTNVSVPEPIIAGAEEFKYYRSPEGFKRLRSKRKVAIVFGYIGERYCGLQWNHLPEYPTVEEVLMKALYETDMISLTNFSQMKVQQLLNFERASRTDKGVHALRNVVSVCVMLPYNPLYVEKVHAGAGATPKMGEDNDDEGTYSCTEAKRLLNMALPQDIHVYDVTPVTRSFNAYLCCGGRRYEYYLPTFALMPRAAYTTEYFPSTLALSHPTLKDVGYRARREAARQRPRKREQMVGSEDSGPRGGGGRKNKGHFPRSKKRRMEDARRAEEAKAAAEEAAVAAQVADQAEGPTSSATLTATKTAESGEDEDLVGVDDDELTDHFLKTHAATHFRDGLFESMILFRTIPEDAMALVGAYRLPAGQLELTREMFRQYEGTHCYHNFTPGGSSTDASCHRFIRQVTVSEPFVVSPDDPLIKEAVKWWTPSRFFAPDESVVEAYEARARHLAAAHEELHSPGFARDTDALRAEEETLRADMAAHMKRVYGTGNGIEVVRIELDGQSFMLNQIRKMIGAVVCMAAAGESPTYINDVLLSKEVRRGIPMVPANGLFLSYLNFSGYNQRLERIQKGGNGDGKGWLEMDSVSQSELEEQRRRIVAVVLRNEMAEDLMGKWMRSLRHVLRLAWKLELP